MKFSRFLGSWDGALKENKWGRVIILILTLVIAVQAYHISTRDQIVVLVPVNLSESAQVSKAGASASFKTSWGMYVASMLGNINPKNAEFTVNSLSEILAPSIYSEIKDSMFEQVSQITKRDVAISFVISSITYDPVVDLVYVTGNSTVTGGYGDAISEVRTYELRIDVRNYMPSLSHVTSYSGNPKIQQRQKEEQEKKNAK